MLPRRFRVLSAILGCALCAPLHGFAQSDERMIYASVVDKAGAPVLGLGVKDFIVREDGVAREILRVAADRDPMQIALLVDDSGLMRGREGPLRKAVSAFIEHMRPDVMMAVIGLGERPTIRADYSRDKPKLLHTVEELFGHGGNALNDAIFESALALAKRPSLRPVIVAITAGGGGYKQREDVLRALKWSQASFHFVGVAGTPVPDAGAAEPASRRPSFEGRAGGRGSRMIEEATRNTGGRNDVIIGLYGLEQKLVQVATELSNQYRVTYARPLRLIPPEKTEIKARNLDLHARGMLVMTEKERQGLRAP